MNVKHAIMVLSLTITAMAQKPAIVASFLPEHGGHHERMEKLFEEYVLPHVDAVMERYEWSELEPSQGNYDFSQMDADIAHWQSKGKKTALIISLVSDRIDERFSNTATPEWVMSRVPTETCEHVANHKIPVIYDSKTMALTQPFILAVLKHLDTKAPWILYDRTGFWHGGENSVECKKNQPIPAVVKYMRAMAEFVHENHPDGTRFVSSCSAWNTTDYPDQLCKVFARYGIGIGIQMLNAQDKMNYQSGRPCTGNWCENFKAHPEVYKYLQPEVRQPPENLLVYVPFAASLGVNAIELRLSDLSIAYYPKNPSYAEFGERYRAILGKN